MIQRLEGVFIAWQRRRLQQACDRAASRRIVKWANCLLPSAEGSFNRAFTRSKGLCLDSIKALHSLLRWSRRAQRLLERERCNG